MNRTGLCSDYPAYIFRQVSGAHLWLLRLRPWREVTWCRNLTAILRNVAKAEQMKENGQVVYPHSFDLLIIILKTTTKRRWSIRRLRYCTCIPPTMLCIAKKQSFHQGQIRAQGSAHTAVPQPISSGLSTTNWKVIRWKQAPRSRQHKLAGLEISTAFRK